MKSGEEIGVIQICLGTSLSRTQKSQDHPIAGLCHLKSQNKRYMGTAGMSVFSQRKQLASPTQEDRSDGTYPELHPPPQKIEKLIIMVDKQ